MIRFEGVSFSYEGRVKVIEAADCRIGPGLTLCLGLNGCGKSTFLKLAAGVEYPDAGRVSLGGRDLWTDEVAARRSLAYLPEQPDLTPYATIRDIIELVCRLRGEKPNRAEEALAAVGLENIADRSVRELSLGQRRRALFATVLIGRPEHILLDEPLEALDRRITAEILSWIAGRRDWGAAVVVVSHVLEPFVDMADRAVTIRAEKIMPVEALPPAPPQKLELLESLARGITV
jgi:ABC-type multidrug transport system ATPase subunit